MNVHVLVNILEGTHISTECLFCAGTELVLVSVSPLTHIVVSGREWEGLAFTESAFSHTELV